MITPVKPLVQYLAPTKHLKDVSHSILTLWLIATKCVVYPVPRTILSALCKLTHNFHHDPMMYIVLIWKRSKWRHREKGFAKGPRCVDSRATTRTPGLWSLSLPSSPRPSSLAPDGGSSMHTASDLIKGPTSTKESCICETKRRLYVKCHPKEKR